MKNLLCCIFVCSLLFSSSAFAGVDCGDFDCEDNELCLDRGEGNDCFQSCRLDAECATNCCIQIRVPYTSWICVDGSECGLSDGDDDEEVDLDDEETVEPDGDSGINVEQGGYGGMCGDDTCNSWQICIELSNGSEACATVCEKHSECASGCCASTTLGQKICLSADEECPSDTDGDSDEEEEEEEKSGCDNKGLFCESASSSFIFGMLMLAWLIRHLAKRKFE